MADAISRFLEWYERDFGIHYTKEQLTGTKLTEIVPGNGSFGVDLNRNYGYKWGYDNVWLVTIYVRRNLSRTSAFSEPETRMRATFAEYILSFFRLITIRMPMH